MEIENEIDDLGIDTEVFVQNGEVIEVRQGGKQIRARVVDYDVQFPCVAHGLKVDSENNYYMEIIV